MSTSADSRLRLYVGGVTALACAVMLLTLQHWPLVVSPVLVALVVVAMLSESLAVQYSTLYVSINTAVIASAIMLLGPAAGALVAGLSAIPASLVARENKLLRGFFNLSQITITGAAAGWAYVAVGGRVLQSVPLTASELPRTILAILCLAVVTFVVNTALVGVVASLASGAPFFAVWKSSFLWAVPTQSTMTVLALALAQAMASVGVAGLVFLVAPLMIARQLYQRYVRLKNAYADTIRSLVAVIETKDAYTKGHSERVAAYSVGIARQLGLSEARIERLELAGLLHDLGKVGISRNILWKSSRLEPDEFRSIKEHPAIGARIVESVPFLSDLAPLVADHHERLDGAGYGRGLTGKDLSLEARILCVADSFDAMTSTRSYRPALSRNDTLREFERCRGQQFDGDCVDALLEAIDSGALPWPEADQVEAGDSSEAV